MKQHSQIILTGIFFAIMIIGLTLINQRVVNSLVAIQTDYEKIVDASAEAKKAGLEAQINFKTQVQEWKNILIRGINDEDFERYFSQFKEREATVKQRLIELGENIETIYPQLGDRAEDLLKVHEKLGEDYRSAVRYFDPADPTSFRTVDGIVRGIDREPQQMMSDLTADVELAFKVALEEALKRVSESKSKTIRASWVLVLIGVLVTGLLVFQLQLDARRLDKARAEALHSSRAKSLFLANMSHEIRTPLNGIIGMLEVLDVSKMDVTQREQFNIIRSSSETLLAILNDILDYSKIEAGKVDIENIPLDVRQTIKPIIALFEPRVVGKGIELRYQVDDAVPQFVRTDPLRFRQILLNLVLNSVKFTNEGRIQVSVGWESNAPSAERGMLFVSVEDTGIGIPKDKVARLFESFYQAESGLDRKYGGTGLGLSICQSLISRMNGTIGVDSTEGKGSTFYFRIPMEVSAGSREDGALPNDVSKADLNNGDRPGTSFQEQHLFPELEASPESGTGVDPSVRILLAEDNPVNQTVAMKVLERLGLTADLATDGEEAIEYVRHNDYDVILMDIQMPRLNGIEATKAIRLLSGSQMKPWIIALTAGALQENKSEAFEAGLNDFISKPFNRSLLKKKLEYAEQQRLQTGAKV